MPDAASPPDFSQLYNTPLTPAELPRFQAWQQANPRLGSTFDYDARGFWKAGGAAAPNGHGADVWKKPNHPTFSDQSQYSGPHTGYTGGRWTPLPGGGYVFTPSATNLRMYQLPRLQDYFQEAEPGNTLVLPP